MKTTNLLRGGIFTVGVMFFLGCSAENGKANHTNQEKPSAAAEVPLNQNDGASTSKDANSPESKVASSKSDKVESIYTDLAAAKCKTIESSEEEAWIVQECPGVGGFKLEVSEGDLRQTITVISPSGKKSELDYSGNVSSGFSALGEKAEWRVKKVGEKVTPFALITRFNVSENPDKPEKTTSYLVVTKISGDGSCIVEVIKPVTNANEKARVSADNSAEKPCMNVK